MKRSEAALILFTLPPEDEGRRKRLGLARAEPAAAVFAALLRHLESAGSAIPGVDLLVASPAPPTSGREERHLLQRGADFGESLRLAVEDAFALGYRRVVVIGNDAPEINRGYLERAFDALREEDPCAAIGPARDGGYALLGLNRPCADVFRAMPWGTSRVAWLTIERLSTCGFRITRLAALEDIDDRAALDRFLTRARQGELAALAQAVRLVLAPSVPRCEDRLSLPARLVLASGHPLRAPPPPPSP